MPWKETSIMDERMKFIGRLLTGEKMAPICKEFGISRVTGHKIWNRYQENGAAGIFNKSRSPHAHPNRTPFAVEQLIVRLKKEKPKWGAPKYANLYPGDIRIFKYPPLVLSTVFLIGMDL